MDIHKCSTAFVHRYRALWDKIMGFLVLMHCNDVYDDYRRAKSRRKYFLRFAKETPEIGEEFGKNLSSILSKFDNRFRTPEVHGTGSLRKWSFQMVGVDENPQIELLGYWNLMNEVIAKLQEQIHAWHMNQVDSL